MDVNLTVFDSLPIKKEVEDFSDATLQKIPDLNKDSLLTIDFNKCAQLEPIASVSSTTPPKSNTPKKRTRRRYVYSKPKKKRKKKDDPENVVSAINVCNEEQFIKNKDNHSDCSSDTIILDDLSEEVSKDSANIGNEFSNSLPKEAELQPPELGRLLISDGMLLDEKNGAKRKKASSAKSRAKNTKSKGKQSQKMQPGLMNEFENMPISFKKEPEETLEPPVLFPIIKEPTNIFSKKDSTFPGNFQQDVTNSFPAPFELTVSENKKRKPQTARRGKKKQISSERAINDTKNNVLTFDNYLFKGGNDMLVNETLVDTREIPLTLNITESIVTKKTKARKTVAKKRSPAKRNIPTTVADISDNDKSVSNFPIPPFANVMEQNNVSGPTSHTLTESKQNSKRKSASPRKKMTAKGNAKSLETSEANNDKDSCSLPPVKKTKGRSPRKTPTKKSSSYKQKVLNFVDKECAVKSSLVISVKKELNDSSDSSNSNFKCGVHGNTEEYVDTDKLLSKNISNPVPFTKKGSSKTYVSLSFEEDTTKKDEPDEHLSFLLSLRNKNPKSKNTIDTESLKNHSESPGMSSEPNFKRTSIFSSNPPSLDPKLGLENLVGNLPGKSSSTSEKFVQSNESAIDLNIPNIKKEIEHFPTNPIEMQSVNQVGAESTNKSPQSVMPYTSQSTLISNSHIHTSQNSVNSRLNLEKPVSSDVIQKNSISTPENESTILRRILNNVEKLKKNDNEMKAMKSLNELAKTCLNHDLTELISKDNNVNISEIAQFSLGTKPKLSETIITSGNSDANNVLNRFAFDSEHVPDKACELPSITLPHIQIKKEPEALPDIANKAKDSGLDAQIFHTQRTSPDSLLKDTCLSNETDTSPSTLNVDKIPRSEQCELNSLSGNTASSVKTGVMPITCVADTTCESQDYSVLNQKKTCGLSSIDFLNIQIKKERDEEIKDSTNIDKRPSSISPVALVESNEKNTTRLTEKLPRSDSIITRTTQPLQNSVCNDDNAVSSTSQTFLQNSSNIVSSPIVSIKKEICSNTDDIAVALHKSTNSNQSMDISTSASEKQSLVNTEVTQIEKTSATRADETSNVSFSTSSYQNRIVSDLLMADAEESFAGPITSPSVIIKNEAENRSVYKSTSLISDSLHLRSKDSILVDDDVIVISDDSSSESSCESSVFDSDNESMHSLGDLEGPPKKKTCDVLKVNLSTGEVIYENQDTVSRKQNDSTKKSSDDKPESEHQKDLNEFAARVSDHVTRFKALNKEKEMNLEVVDSEESDNESTPCRIATPVCETLENSLDSIMTCHAPGIKNSEEFDFLVYYKKNELKFRKHPYPGDIPLRKRKPDTGYYFRYDKDKLDLTFENIEKKLKESEKVNFLAPDNPDDAQRLDVYRIVPEELDCYYEVLTTNPTLALISNYSDDCTVSTEDCNPIDDVICLPCSPVVQSGASLSEVSVHENKDKDVKGSMVNNKTFVPCLTEKNKEPVSLPTNNVVLLNKTTEENSQQLKSDSDISIIEVLEINTDTRERITEGSTVSLPEIVFEHKLTNLSTAIEDSMCRNNFTNNESIQSNKFTAPIEMSESSSSGVQEAFSVDLPGEKIHSEMIPNSNLALSVNKSDNFVSLTTNVETSVKVVDSNSETLNYESTKDISCDSNNPVLLVEKGSSFNSIPELSFSDINVLNSIEQSSSNLNVPADQFSDSSSNYSKILPVPKTSENSFLESALNLQIEEQSTQQVSLQVKEPYCSEKDENSLAAPSLSSVTIPILPKLDLPTSELRKILETVNILPTPECSEPPSNLLNFPESYQYDHANYSPVSSQHVVDYGHGISARDRSLNVSHYGAEYSYYDGEPLIKIPVVRDYGHKSVKDLDDSTSDPFSEGAIPTTIETRHEVSIDTLPCSKPDLAPGSDDDTFDNDSEYPIESSNEQDSKESEQKLDEKKEPREKPQYKSRFQRVMERVSSKKSPKAQSSDNQLTDCFPLKSLKNASSPRKPIALVQPCSQKLTKNPPKGKKSPLSNNPTSTGDSKKTKETKKSKKSKSTVQNKKKIKKSPLKSMSLEDASSLFQPDKIVKKDKMVKKSETKEKLSASKSNPVKSNESPGSRVYGRVTNRGSFLTQSSINQPPKPKAPVKKSVNKIKVAKVPTDELHSMVHTPKIDIIPNKKLPTYSNELFKSHHKFESSVSFIESYRTTINAKSIFNPKNQFLTSPLRDPRTTLKKLSPDIACSSPSESSNFFITPEPLISSDLPINLPVTHSRKACLPRNPPLLPKPDVRPEIPLAGRRTLLPTPPIKKIASDNEAWFTSSVHHQNYSDPLRNIPGLDFELEASLLTMNSPSISGSPVNFNPEPLILTGQSSVASISNRGSHRHSRPRQSKCVCLPPKSLKASVGNAVFDTSNVLLLILEWNVDWLVQQQKNHDPPPISTSLRKVINTYEDSDEYYNTYLPLMLLETWQRIYMSWTHLHQSASPYFCEITSYSVETHSIKVQCQAVFKSSDAERGLFPEEGNIIMVKFGTKEKGGIKILGYIREVKVRPFDVNNDSASASYKVLKYTAGESLQMLTLTFSGAYSSDEFDIKQLIRIQILCNIKSTLKQNDALLHLKNSPLFRNILNPLTDGLRMVTLVPRTADKSNVSECVRDIIKGILSPHPLPLLTIAKSSPSSESCLILPPLVEMMKNSYKTKVLLCTRTSKALTNIGCSLWGGTVKFIIIGKKSDIHQKLRKYLLEEVASKKLTKELKEDSPISEDKRNDLLINIKLDILKNCDVILSLIRNCHDDLVAQAYADGDSIAQMCCIIDEANLCTEPEILIPLLYGISKLILIGDPEVPSKVCSKAASNFDYNRSLFHRAYELDVAFE